MSADRPSKVLDRVSVPAKRRGTKRDKERKKEEERGRKRKKEGKYSGSVISIKGYYIRALS
jgi:hypothetical protein